MSSRSMLWRSLRYLRRSLVYINQYYGQGITAGMLSDMSTLLDLPASYPHGLLEGETQTALPPIPCSPQQPEDMVTKVAALMPWVGKLMSYVSLEPAIDKLGICSSLFPHAPLAACGGGGHALSALSLTLALIHHAVLVSCVCFMMMPGPRIGEQLQSGV